MHSVTAIILLAVLVRGDPAVQVPKEIVKDGQEKPSAVIPDAGAAQTGSDAGSAQQPQEKPAAQKETVTVKTHNIVGSWNNWDPKVEPMQHADGLVRRRITVREDAADSPQQGAGKREEFQILGDGDWNKRIHPAGNEEDGVVILQPGVTLSRLSFSDSKGHGRNWAIEGNSGSSFDIVLNPKEQVVYCESVPSLSPGNSSSDTSSAQQNESASPAQTDPVLTNVQERMKERIQKAQSEGSNTPKSDDSPASNTSSGTDSVQTVQQQPEQQETLSAQDHERFKPVVPPKTHHIVGSWNNWDPKKEEMKTPKGSEGGPVQHRITVREDAPDSPQNAAKKREEFQIVGDGSWGRRLYPAGGDQEEVVVLQPGGSPSHATFAVSDSKGHGRNWAVEGDPGASFDIILDPEVLTVKSHFHSRNIIHNEI